MEMSRSKETGLNASKTGGFDGSHNQSVNIESLLDREELEELWRPFADLGASKK